MNSDVPNEAVSDRSHVSGPGVSLHSVDVRPELLQANLRAGLFPLSQQKIRVTIINGMARQAWRDISDMERLYIRSCPHVTLKHVGAVHEVSAHNAGGTDDVTPTFVTPFPAKIFDLRPPTPQRHLTIPSPMVVPTNTSTQLPPPPLPPSASSPPLAETVVFGPRHLSSELWTIDRCNSLQTYLVRYYGDGDLFYARILPTNWSQLFNKCRIVIAQKLKYS